MVIPSPNKSDGYTRASLERMRVWPNLPATPLRHRHYGAAYVIRHADERQLFWRAPGRWLNIQRPELGSPSIFVARPVADERGRVLLRWLHSRAIVGAEWVRVGFAIPLLTHNP